MNMKRVCFLLSHGKRLTELEKLIRKLQMCGMDYEAKLAEAEYEAAVETLYITDCAEVAGELLEKELPVLAFLHEENGRADFSRVKYACEEPGELEPEYLERVYRRYKGLPWDILETERCILRESVEEDVEAFYEIYAESSITRYMEALYESRISERAYIREYIEKVYSYYEFGIWTVILKETGEIIGRAGLSVREGYDLPELGYVIGVPWQGRGLAKEVCQGILQYARNEFGFDKVQAVIQKENIVSIGLALDLGFEKQKELWQAGEKFMVFVRSIQ